MEFIDQNGCIQFLPQTPQSYGAGGGSGNGGENEEDGKDGEITLISGNDTYICFNGVWSSSGITSNKFTVDLYYI